MPQTVIKMALWREELAGKRFLNNEPSKCVNDGPNHKRSTSNYQKGICFIASY